MITALVTELLKHPIVVKSHNLLDLRQDRLKAEGLNNMIETAEAELKRMANKYLTAHFAE